MLRTTVGQLLVNDALPPDLRDYNRTLDKKSINSLFQQLAEKYPDQYKDIAHRINQIGGEAAYANGMSFGLRDMRTSEAAKAVHEQIRQEVAAIQSDPNLSDEEKEKRTVLAVGKYQKPLEDAVFDEALREKSPLALQILSGTRGSKMNLKSLRAGDLLYTDHRDRVIPVPVLSPYSKGLSPAEYYAGAFGARKGVLDTKGATADAGYMAKQLVQATHRLIATKYDEENPPPDADTRGYPVQTADQDNEGALLAREAGGYPRNTVLTPRILKELRQKGINRILLRSPILGGPPEGGVYARDVGVRERGGLPPIGDYVGIAASQALSEKLTQGQLCLALGTEVRMADWSVRPIEAVESGDWVLGANMEGDTFPVRVIAAHDNGTRPVYRTKFRHGMTQRFIYLDSTLDHKLLVIINKSNQKAAAMNGKPQLAAVGYKTRHFSGVLSGAFIDDRFLRDEPFDLAVGVALGDGCYTDSVHGSHLSCWDPTLIADLEPELTALNLKLSKLQGHRGYYRFSQITEASAQRDGTTGRILGGYRNPMMMYLDSHGMLGKYAHEKELPADVYTWSNRSVARLIGGLCVTDGSVYVSAEQKSNSKPYIGFGSTSLRMAEQFRELLATRFGIYATPLFPNSQDRKRTLWQTTISTHEGIRRFAKHIPLFGIKKKLLEEHLSNWVVKRPMRYFRCNRQRQDFLGDLPTRDLEVDHPDHLFVLANGLIVSNSSKHSGGVAGAGAATSGFKYIDQLVQTPKHFPGGATHAQADGNVTAITEQPQGGRNVTIAGVPHYVPADRSLKVEVGSPVEAGDVISEGIPNPAEIVKHKGVGEGRRYFVDAFRDAYANSGMGANRRNIELLARGLINHVRLTDEVGDWVPDDIVPYSAVESTYEPRPGAVVVSPRSAIGKYLEKPVLHHSIGTKVRPSMLKDLDEFGIKSVMVHPEPPPFEPAMVRGMATLQDDPDWLTRHLGSNLQKATLDAVHRNRSSDTAGTSFVPALAGDPANFGVKGLTKGW